MSASLSPADVFPPAPDAIARAATLEVEEAKLVSRVLAAARNKTTDLSVLRDEIERLDPSTMLRVSDRVATHLEKQAARTGDTSTLDRVVPYLPGQGDRERAVIEQEAAQVRAPSLDARALHAALDTVIADRRPNAPTVEIVDLSRYGAAQIARHEAERGAVELPEAARRVAMDIDGFKALVAGVRERSRGNMGQPPELPELIAEAQAKIKVASQPFVETPAVEITRRGSNSASAEPEIPARVTPERAVDPAHIQAAYEVREQDGVRRYYQRDDGQLAIRADESRIQGMLRDPTTIGAMLDLAAARGWNEVQVRGDREMARETWIEANVRGMRAEGYAPTREDAHAVEQRRVEQGLQAPERDEDQRRSQELPPPQMRR